MAAARGTAQNALVFFLHMHFKESRAKVPDLQKFVQLAVAIFSSTFKTRSKFELGSQKHAVESPLTTAADTAATQRHEP